MAVPKQDLETIGKYCEDRVPKKLRGQVRVVSTARGNSVTIAEQRPLWSEVSDEWVSQPVAQLRFDPDAMSWTLLRRQQGRWEPLPDVAPGDLDAMLDELTADHLAAFWGRSSH